ncbi:hypothetical protein NX02_23450 [Sphingomonas sanxanigenens DSM 19645 = NX02]|uniref:Uncharacterized protein n=2 Tax=Sphingomonas sanxanigenens TaxID=397260 RepID=W0AKU0_9SPHN|nr:hypothetical protein NX02_23450 [Sphingomonas sanxanigenens DSM 19645 = NX02]
MPFMTILAGVMLAVEPVAVPACTLPPLSVDVDLESFVASGRDASPERIAAIRMGTMANLGRAFYLLCTDGKVTQATLAGRALTIRNGEGAADPRFYVAEGAPKRLVLQFAFGDGPPPSTAQASHALLCLAHPHEGACAVDDA